MTTASAVDQMSAESWVPLVARIAAGEREAERLFVQQFRRGILALARRHSRPNDPAVEDIVQDVIFHVIERMRQGAINDPVALPAYIRMTVVNATTAEYRRRKLRSESVALDDIAELLIQSDGPGDRFDAEQIGLRIRQLVEELPVRRDRDVLVRFYLQDRDKADICRELGIDASHFHRVIHRARERFRLLAKNNGLDGQGETSAAVGAPKCHEPAQRLGTGTTE